MKKIVITFLLMILLIFNFSTASFAKQLSYEDFKCFCEVIEVIIDAKLIVYENQLIDITFENQEGNYQFEQGYLIGKIIIKKEYKGKLVRMVYYKFKNLNYEIIAIPQHRTTHIEEIK